MSERLMIDTLLDTESLIIHLFSAGGGWGWGRLGLARGNVQFSKIKLNVSCRVHQPLLPASGRGGGRRDSSDTLGTEPNL